VSLSQQYSGSMSPAPQGNNLADVLERVLDKGLVVAGDIRINLLDIELLTIKVRLLLASADKARELGITWWESDPFLSGEESSLEAENRELRERMERLESRIAELPEGNGASEDEGSRSKSTRKRQNERA
jgi:hypothetical protein